MVDRSYLLEHPAPPSAMKRYFDQVAIPAAIDHLALMESAANRIAHAARRTPLTALALALGGGIALAMAIDSRRKRR
jgi:hypothetical protein